MDRRRWLKVGACAASLALGAAAPAVGCSSNGPASGAPAGDASSDAAPVTAQDAGPTEDAAGPTCPAPLTTTPAFLAPTGYPQNACGSEDVATVLDGCFGPNATAATCSSAASAVPGCYSCLLTLFSPTGGAAGPIVVISSSYVELNTAGCLALEMADAGCATAFGAVKDCIWSSCASCGGPPANFAEAGATSVPPADYQQCLNEVLDAGCAPYFAAERAACPASDPAFTTCAAPAGNLTTTALAYAQIFCGAVGEEDAGSPPIDAGHGSDSGSDSGSDAGSVSDSGSDSGSDAGDGG